MRFDHDDLVGPRLSKWAEEYHAITALAGENQDTSSARQTAALEHIAEAILLSAQVINSRFLAIEEEMRKARKGHHT
jgi:hypothetical protein